MLAGKELATRGRLRDPFQDMRMAVAKNERSLAEREVEVLVAVDVPDSAPFAMRVKERMGMAELTELAGNAPRQHGTCAIIQLPGPGVAFHAGACSIEGQRPGLRIETGISGTVLAMRSIWPDSSGPRAKNSRF